MSHDDSTGRCECGWERHAQAFRWFPEMGPPVRAHGDEARHRDDVVPRATRVTVRA
ncbi:MAG: hypothetical protein ABW212_01405 [Pseudonocardia sediminis]